MTGVHWNWMLNDGKKIEEHYKGLLIHQSTFAAAKKILYNTFGTQWNGNFLLCLFDINIYFWKPWTWLRLDFIKSQTFSFMSDNEVHFPGCVCTTKIEILNLI